MADELVEGLVEPADPAQSRPSYSEPSGGALDRAPAVRNVVPVRGQPFQLFAYAIGGWDLARICIRDSGN